MTIISVNKSFFQLQVAFHFKKGTNSACDSDNSQ